MLELENCPWCGGTGTVTQKPCPACGGEKLVTRRVAKAIHSVIEEQMKNPTFAFSVIGGLRKVDQERAGLAELPVPAAFTKDKPDTPEAQAARIQNLQSQKGLDIIEARRLVLGT